MDQDQHSLPPPADSTPETQPAAFSWPKLLVNMVLLPALVVAGLVAVVIGVQWLTAPTGDVPALVDQIAQGGQWRRPAAMELAARLGEPDAAHLRRDPALAERLGTLLRRQLPTEPGETQDLQVCIFLCRALGEFEIADPLPALIEAVEAVEHKTVLDETGPGKLPGAQPGDTEGLVVISCAALEAIAQLAARLEPQERAAAGRLWEVLLAASRNPSPAIRLRAAFALGIVGGEDAQARLEAMLDDPVPDVRFNAAVGLARLGSAAGVSVLGEMLQYAAASTPEQQTLVRLNALRALGRLADRGAAVASDERKALLPAVRELARSGSAPEVRNEAKALLVRLDTEP